MPRRYDGRVGERASAATAGSARRRRAGRRRSPWIAAAAGDGQTGVVQVTVGAHRVRRPRSASPGWVVAPGQSRHGHRAAGDQRQRQERRGVGEVGLDRGRPRRERCRAHAPPVRLAVVDLDARARAGTRSSSRCAGATAPACRRGARRRPGRSGRRRAAAPRRTGWRPRRRSPPVHRAPRRCRPRRTGACRGRRRRRGHRTRASRSSTSAIGRVRACGSPSKCTVALPVRPPAARSASRCRPVRSRPSLRRRTDRASTCQSSPDVSTAEPSAVSAAAISSVSRERSARRTTEGPSARAASTSARLVSDFEPGSATVARTGVRAYGAGQGSAAVTECTRKG